MPPRSQAVDPEPRDALARWADLAREAHLGRSSSTPLHARISQLVIELIENGSLAPGEKLPPERELAALFGVSLAPVRQAILDVVSRGLLVRDRGRGTFVRNQAWDEKISILHSLTESMRDQHVDLEARVLRQEEIAAPAGVAQALQMAGDRVLLLERLAILRGEPVALLQSHLAADAFPGLAAIPITGRSLYETLRDRYGTIIDRAESVIEIARANSAQADRLGISVGQPLLRLDGTAFTAEGTPVEHYNVLYRGDRVRFHVESRRTER